MPAQRKLVEEPRGARIAALYPLVQLCRGNVPLAKLRSRIPAMRLSRNASTDATCRLELTIDETTHN